MKLQLCFSCASSWVCQSLVQLTMIHRGVPWRRRPHVIVSTLLRNVEAQPAKTPDDSATKLSDFSLSNIITSINFFLCAIPI